MRGEGWSSPYSDPASAAGGYAASRGGRGTGDLARSYGVLSFLKQPARASSVGGPPHSPAARSRGPAARVWSARWGPLYFISCSAPAPGRTVGPQRSVAFQTSRRRAAANGERLPWRGGRNDTHTSTAPPRGVRDHIYEQRGITRWHDPLHKMECPIHSRFLVIILHTPFDEEWRHKVMGGFWRDGARPPVSSFGQ